MHALSSSNSVRCAGHHQTRRSSTKVVSGPSHATGVGRLGAAAYGPPRTRINSMAFSSLATGGPMGPRAHSSASQALNRRTLGLLTLAAAATDAAPTSKDILVVGPGVLGSYLGKLWLDANPNCTAVGMTNTTNSHERLKALGMQAHVKSEVLSAGKKYPFVVFSAPPSGSEDYAAEVAAAMSLWDGSGSFVFTGSNSVVAVDDGGVAREDAKMVAKGAGPSTDRLLAAEDVVLQGGGNVVRLVGLYHAKRGAHTFFLKTKEIQRYGGYLVNLIHYEDAARITFSILAGEGSGPFRSRVFLGCDNHPVTFEDMIVYCNKSGVPELMGEVKFTQDKPDPSKKGLGKKCYNDVTRDQLGGWKPRYDSFESFMADGAKDFFTTSGLY